MSDNLRQRIHKGRESKADRLLRQCIPVTETGCWLWEGIDTTFGHGRVSYGGRKHVASRLSYEAFIGPIPPGKLVCHKCDVPACINPAHLYLGTGSTNIYDAIARGRWKLKERWATRRRNMESKAK